MAERVYPFQAREIPRSEYEPRFPQKGGWKLHFCTSDVARILCRFNLSKTGLTTHCKKQVKSTPSLPVLPAPMLRGCRFSKERQHSLVMSGRTATVVRHSKNFSTFLEENVSLTCCRVDIVSMKIGYARVSTDEQDTAAQVGALENYGCTTIYKENKSGGKAGRWDRPEL